MSIVFNALLCPTCAAAHIDLFGPKSIQKHLPKPGAEPVFASENSPLCDLTDFYGALGVTYFEESLKGVERKDFVKRKYVLKRFSKAKAVDFAVLCGEARLCDYFAVFERGRIERNDSESITNIAYSPQLAFRHPEAESEAPFPPAAAVFVFPEGIRLLSVCVKRPKYSFFVFLLFF